MKEKRNLYYLADILSAQTQIERKVVLAFLNQLFKQIERGLMVSSAVKIDNLGIFRIIKSLSGDRLLFLGKFASDTISPRMTDGMLPEKDSVLSDETADTALSETWLPDTNSYAEEIISPNTEESATTNNSEERVFDDEKQAKKKKLWRKIKIYVLFFATFVIVSGVLYALYPKKKDDTVTKEQQFSPFIPMFTELDNNDTASFSHVIQIINSNVDFYSLSKIYYLHEQFWPYIYNANETVVSGPFEIPEGAIIKIPKLDAELIDYKNPSNVDKAKALVNKIMNSSAAHTAAPDKN
jgi:hypothetical protein